MIGRAAIRPPRTGASSAASRSFRRRVPSFALYGEPSGAPPGTDFLHVESIPSRSRKYLWKIGNHRHVGLCQCLYVTEGPVAADLEGSRSSHRGPVILIIPAGTIHGFGFEPSTEGYVLTMDLDRLLGVAGGAYQAAIAALFAGPLTLDLCADRALALRAAGLFENLLREFSRPDSLLAPVGGWLACSVLWLIATASLRRAPAGAAARIDWERLRRFRRLVELHYLERWPVGRYAREVGLSESSLNRVCTGLGGGTAFDIIQRRLALEARRRLEYAGAVSTIASELGFRDAAYFCRFFRKHNAVSPAAFRRRQRDGST